jgi:hypothetical protein
MVNEVNTIRCALAIGKRPGKILGMAAAIAAASMPVPAPAAPVTITARVNAKVVKPLVLKRVRDLDLGTVLVPRGAWAGATLRLARTGTLTCPASLTCSGASQTAIYNLTGSNQTTVRISAPDVRLVNQSDPSKTLTMVVDSPGTVTLPNSGNIGQDFPLGGSIELDSSTADGAYVGTFKVTVDY